MSNNHQNRSRHAVLAALDEYKKSAEYEVLTQIPIHPDKIIQALEKRVSQAYESGFKAGRKSK